MALTAARTAQVARRNEDRFLANTLAAAKDYFRRDRWVYAAIVLHCAFSIALLTYFGFERSFAFDSYLYVWPVAFLLLFPTLSGLWLALQIVHRIDRRRRLACRLVFSPKRVGRIAAGLVLLAAFMLFQGSFTSIKNAAPLFWGGFPFDVVQADLDRWLHFGRDPWVYLHQWDGSGLLLHIVEFNYVQGWFLLCFGTLFTIAVAPGADRIRTRYLLSYVAVWTVVGNVLAISFLSAGPVYFEEVTGDATRFADLERILATSDTVFSAAAIQASLWQLYSLGEGGMGSGISAFPSVHVALVTLNALFLYEWKPRLGLFGLAYVVFILLSSVYLGWHYAIDGYAGAAVAAAIYLLMRKWLAPAVSGGRISG